MQHDATSSSPETDPLESLHPDSYTRQRVLHCTPEHLYLTSRRAFIGPIPEGWLKSHRHEWYKHHLGLRSKSIAFAGQDNVNGRRSVTGLDNPQERHARSFPQPLELAEEEDNDYDNDDDGDDDDNEHSNAKASMDQDSATVTTDGPPAIAIPRAEDQAPEVLKGDDTAAVPRKPILHIEEQDTEQSAVHKDYGSGKIAIKKKDHSVEPLKTSPVRLASFKSFVTARETMPETRLNPETSPTSTKRPLPPTDGQLDVPKGDVRGSSSATAGSATSSTPLLDPEPVEESLNEPGQTHPRGILSKMKAKVAGGAPAEDDDVDKTRLRRVSFVTPGARELQAKSKVAQLNVRKGIRRMRQAHVAQGEAVKLEKMLVRVELTKHDIPDEFDENDGRKIDSQILDKWKEFMVVCREAKGDDTDYTVQLYKTRVIKAVEKEQIKTKSAYDIPLKRQTVKVSLYSSLDKTIVLCQPVRGGNRLYVMRPRCAANSMEWFTFLRNILGLESPSTLQVNVPDLSVHLKLDRPFQKVEDTSRLAQAAVHGDAGALDKTLQTEEEAADTVVERCMTMLDKSKDWHDMLHTWTRTDHVELVEGEALGGGSEEPRPGVNHRGVSGYQPVGLSWRRYDRIEWIQGASEKMLYSTIGMERSHELELRPKIHYPTSVKNAKGATLIEPAAVEGFLVRLSSQKGDQQRFGRLFFKRLYFSTHNQFFAFNRPAQADPPPPPKLPMRTDSKVPSSHQIAEAIPLIYAVNPFPLQDGQTSWLTPEDTTSASANSNVQLHDRDAADEDMRRNALIVKSDGLINLCNVVRVRSMVVGASPVDASLDPGSNVDFDDQVQDDNSPHDDGTITDMDVSRSFELVLNNGLILRLQAYDRTTKVEWMQRLSALVVYWRQRVAADAALLKSVRAANLSLLHIDEDREALIGQYAHKWEMSQSFASSEVHHMCGLAHCRSICISGFLFRKARQHAAFVRSLVVLAGGQLLIFRDGIRSLSGGRQPHVHHEKLTGLPLRDCYVYSGLVTEADLAYSPDAGGALGVARGLPRRYAEDGWSSTDEDAMTTFVIWHGRRSSWFRSEEEVEVKEPGQLQQQEKASRRSRLKKVSALGVEGRSAVFKCRSRAERDRWVMAIGAEIERLSTQEEVRVV